MLKRMWINQPSTLQPHHKLHGVNVLFDTESPDTVVYFLTGPVICQQVQKIALSPGWRETLTLTSAEVKELTHDLQQAVTDYRVAAKRELDDDSCTNALNMWISRVGGKRR